MATGTAAASDSSASFVFDSAMFVPVANEDSPGTPPTQPTSGSLSTHQLTASLRAQEWVAYNRVELSSGSLQDLVRMIDAAPLAPAELQVARMLRGNNLFPLTYIEGVGEKRLLIAVSVEDNNGTARLADNIRWALEEPLGFLFDRQNLRDKLALVVLTQKDFEQIATQDMISRPEARRHFLHEYDSAAMGREIGEKIFHQAIKLGASDIHIEPTFRVDPFSTTGGMASGYEIRFRVDGVLIDGGHWMAPAQGISLVTYIKQKSNMDIANHLTSQDGQTQFSAEDITQHPYLRGYSARVSTIPTTLGETAVLRLHEAPKLNEFTVTSLKLPPRVERPILDILSTPDGILIVTGPTGSGKSRSLYTMLLHVRDGSKKIITIEDPVEIPIPGITQVQVSSHGGGMDFKSILRATLRQDPNILLIGEIRDFETADTAMNASNTGHLVFATLHTNSSILSLPRLRDIGMKPAHIIESIKGVLAQRLVRVCCPSCVMSYEGRDELNEMLRLADKDKFRETIELFKPNPIKQASCEECHGIGYKGRHLAVEFWEPTEKEKAIIYGNDNFSTREIYESSRSSQDFRPLAVDGIRLALEGITSLHEVYANIAIPRQIFEYRGIVHKQIKEFLRGR
jgi:type II secretory ATPase GspE/PulE/Tfp pilus assembly ATPase PilB-like protein